MGSTGKNQNTAPDVFNGMLGERKAVDSIEQKLTDINENNTVNPHYLEGSEYRENCALCTTATLLQLMGYDVEAMPRDTNNWRGVPSVFKINYRDTDNFMIPAKEHHFYSDYTSRHSLRQMGVKSEDIHTTPRGPKKVAEAITQQVQSWGDGAFGEIIVDWKSTSSTHSVVVANVKGKVIVYDSQCNRAISETPSELESYLRRTTANSTHLYRVDNATIKQGLLDYPDTGKKVLDKMVKSRKK